MNFRGQNFTPLSCYPIDRNASPTLPYRLSCDLKTCQITTQKNHRSQGFVERFESLPDVHDKDSIFSDSSSDELAEECKTRNKYDDFGGVHGTNPSKISCITVPKLQPCAEAKNNSTDSSLCTLRRKIEEAALLEAMSSPGRILRECHAAEATCGRPSEQTNAQMLLNESERKKSSRDVNDFDGNGRRGTSQPPSLRREDRERDNDPPFSQWSTLLQPGHRHTEISAFTEIGRQMPPDKIDENIRKSHCDRSQIFDTYTLKTSVPHIELTPKPCQSSRLGNTPASSDSISQSSFGSEVKCHNTSKVRSSSSQCTAYTAETLTVDISSKDSSDSSDTSKYSIAHEDDFSDAPVDKSSGTVIFNHVKQDPNEGCEVVNINRNLCDRASGGASTPRSALLEKCGWSHHHRFARHRVASSLNATAEQSFTIVPLHHLSSAIVVNNNYMRDEESNLEEKRALVNELNELREWKIKVLEELDNKTQEVEALKQQTANHANEMELLRKEATKKTEQHIEEVSRLKSQINILQNECDEKQGMIALNTAKIRELEHTVKCREMELFTKNHIIDTTNAKIEELKMEPTSLLNENIKITKETDDLKAWKVVAEKSIVMRAKEVMALSNENEELRELIKDLELRLKSSN